jgi:hypothetical protein
MSVTLNDASGRLSSSVPQATTTKGRDFREHLRTMYKYTPYPFFLLFVVMDDRVDVEGGRGTYHVWNASDVPVLKIRAHCLLCRRFGNCFHVRSLYRNA